MRARPSVLAPVLSVLALVGCTAPATSSSSANQTPGVSAQVKADLAPTGSLRVALPMQPSVIASKDASTGALSGIGVDLGRELAARLGVRFDPVLYPNIKAAMTDLNSWDVVFGPTQPSPAIVFSSPFLLIPHTFLVASGAPFQSAGDVDQAGVKIASAAGSPHTPKLEAAIKHAQVVLVPDDQAGITMLKARQVDAFASGGFALFDQARHNPGYRVLDGAFFVAQFGIAMPTGRAAGQAFLTGFLAQARTSGLLQQAITRTGEEDLQVAPAS